MRSNNKVLVCVTPQRNSFRLIKKGASFAKEFDAELFVLYVQNDLDLTRDKKTVELIDELFDMTSKHDGAMYIEVSDDISASIVGFINKNKITHVMLGETMATKVEKLLKKDIVSKVTSSAEGVQFLILERSRISSGHIKSLSYS